jgi:hypothetical protein
MEFGEAVVAISFFALIFGWVYIYFTNRNKERMALIEKGASANLFASSRELFGSLATLKLAMFLIGVAVGALVGNILDATTVVNDGVAYFSMICLFGGIALVVYYLVAQRSRKQE